MATRRPPLLLACLALAGVALAGCGDGGGRDLPPEWRGRDVTEPGWSIATLRAGWGVGMEYSLSSGTEIEWDWLVNGSAPLHFKVLRMQDGQTQTLLSQSSNESAAGLTAPQAGAYHLLWRNEGYLDLRFWYKVPEGGILRTYSKSQGPDCTGGLAGDRHLDLAC